MRLPRSGWFWYLFLLFVGVGVAAVIVRASNAEGTGESAGRPYVYEVPDGVVVYDGFYLREAWDRVWEARLEIEERLGREGFPARDAERVETVGLGDGFGVASLVGDFHSVGAGDLGWCGVRTDLSAACWGLNTEGRLDAPPGEFWEIGVGDRFACGLEAEGRVTCWGDDSRGRLDAPDGVFLDLAVGDRHGCAVGLDFGLACWGYDNAGQASPPEGLFDSVAAGGDYSCAIAVDRTVKCWGRATSDTAEPPDGAFSMVDAGAGAACGLRYDGGAVCWGGDLEAPDGVFRGPRRRRRARLRVTPRRSRAMLGKQHRRRNERPRGPFLVNNSRKRLHLRARRRRGAWCVGAKALPGRCWRPTTTTG